MDDLLAVCDSFLTQHGMTPEISKALQYVRARMFGAMSRRERGLRVRIREMLEREWPSRSQKTLRIVSRGSGDFIKLRPPDSGRLIRAQQLLDSLGSRQVARVVSKAFATAQRSPASLNSGEQAELLIDYVALCSLPDAPKMTGELEELEETPTQARPTPGVASVLGSCRFVLNQGTAPSATPRARNKTLVVSGV